VRDASGKAVLGKTAEKKEEILLTKQNITREDPKGSEEGGFQRVSRVPEAPKEKASLEKRKKRQSWRQEKGLVGRPPGEESPPGLPPEGDKGAWRTWPASARKGKKKVPGGKTTETT